MLRLVPMSHTGTVKWAFLNKHAQSHLKPACALLVEMWKVLIPICRVPYLWERDARNLKDYYHIRRSSNVELFGIDIVWEDNVEDKDDDDWVESMDNDSVMSDDGKSDE
jgi:hypothetical protein